MSPVFYRPLRTADSFDVAMLVAEVYRQSCSNEATPAALLSFLRNLDPNLNTAMVLYHRSKREIMIVAENHTGIVGVIIGGRECTNKLFVRNDYQRRGIATDLICRFENTAKSLRAIEIKARASIFATPFYAKRGFRKTPGLRRYGGMMSYPMRKELVPNKVLSI